MKMRILAGIAAATAVLLLAGCAAGSGGSGAPLPTVVLGQDTTTSGGTSSATAAPAATSVAANVSTSAPGASGVVASAVIAPADQAVLVSGMSGRIAAVLVAEGSPVQAGQTLLTFDDQAALAQLAQAQAALAAAQADYDVLAAGPTDEALRQPRPRWPPPRLHWTPSRPGRDPSRWPRPRRTWPPPRRPWPACSVAPPIWSYKLRNWRWTRPRTPAGAAQSTRDATCGSSLLAGSECDAAQAQVLVAETHVSRPRTNWPSSSKAPIQRPSPRPNRP